MECIEETGMRLPEEGMLLRVFIGESDKYHGKPLYEQIVLKARKLHCAGATVIKGIMGFGACSRMHSAKVLRLSEDLPVVVELVDTEEKLNELMPFLDEAVLEGLITRDRVKVVKYRAGDAT
jgi:PII-like signaling protein